MPKQQLDDWNRLPKKIRTNIFKKLDPVSKLNLSLCSRRTYNNLVGKCVYFAKLKIQHFKPMSRDECYMIKMYYDDDEKKTKVEGEEDEDEEEDYYDEDDEFYDRKCDSENYIEVYTYSKCNNDEESDNYDTMEYGTGVAIGGEAYEKDEPNQNRFFNSPKFEIESTSRGSMQTVAFNHFKRFLKKNGRFLSSIDLAFATSPSMFHYKKVKSEVGEFTNLKYLNVGCVFAVEFFVSRITDNLKVLKLTSWEAFLYGKLLKEIVKFPPVFEVADLIDAKYLELTYEHLIRLKAKVIKASMQSISDQKLNQFVRGWSIGESQQSLEYCQLDFDKEKYKVDIDSVLVGLNATEVVDNTRKIISKHDPRSYMLLKFSDKNVSFCVKSV